jgi:hypothetical protein
MDGCSNMKIKRRIHDVDAGNARQVHRNDMPDDFV